jgi:hypothetical protein
VTTLLARLVAVAVGLLALGSLAGLLRGLPVDAALVLLLVAAAVLVVVRSGGRGAGRTRTRYW